jgi:hypothetical protein
MVSPDPTNASNLSSGDVPLAQLGNAPATNTTVIEDDIALLGFKVAVAGTMAKYNLVDQTEDAFMDATGVDASASTGETRNSTSNYYSVGGASPTATGGTITTDGSYTIHSFLSGTSNYVNDTTQATDVLVVAGGGGSGTGGGGAGGMLTSAALSVSAGTYSVTVGTGGASGGGTAVPGVSGINSSFPTLIAIGGGGGGRNDVGYGHADGPKLGGSGGGVGATSTTSLVAAPGTAGQGNAGGTNPSASAPGYAGSGGGGAGAVGVGGAGTANGNGGVGLENAYRTGSNVFYAGGGAGGNGGGTSSGGTGGTGGGGNAGVDGVANSGGGGGGGSAWGDGGSGIVVLRRLTSVTVPASMVLQSNSTTAEATATKGDIVMTYTNGSGTATLNTDLTAEFSADNGSNWTSMTLVAQGTTGSASPHFIVSAHNVTAGTSGTVMKYRIKTFNQGVSKETRIQAVSLGWS